MGAAKMGMKRRPYVIIAKVNGEYYGVDIVGSTLRFRKGFVTVLYNYEHETTKNNKSSTIAWMKRVSVDIFARRTVRSETDSLQMYRLNAKSCPIQLDVKQEWPVNTTRSNQPFSVKTGI